MSWNFENDKPDILSGSDEEIKRMNSDFDFLAEILKSNPGLTLTVEGHTSTQADDAYNLKLSQGRADFVRAEILKKLPNNGAS